jgi:hypothetical protein
MVAAQVEQEELVEPVEMEMSAARVQPDAVSVMPVVVAAPEE